MQYGDKLGERGPWGDSTRARQVRLGLESYIYYVDVQMYRYTCDKHAPHIHTYTHSHLHDVTCVCTTLL